MAGIPDHVLDEIRERADIVEIIGEVVALKKRGRNWVGLCPFHPEKTPSFNVTPDKGMYYCFGCQAGGNVITFLMEHEKLAFPEAVQDLAERTGVEIPEPEARAGPDPSAPLYTANRLAAEFYHRRLLEGPDAEPAREYLGRRRIGSDLWEIFLLGWAPESWDALVAECARHGIDAEELARAGLAARSDKTSGLYDRFRGRVVFPIRSVGGKVVALSGRRLDDVEPKYLNSADSPVFTKGRMLFNLDLAKGPIRREGAVVVVEGNFDVVSLYGAGIRNVVAPLGTAFTAEQARVLKRYTRTAYLAYDGDRAGERSAFRAADLLLSAGFSVRIARLPDGKDPDALVREAGGEAFRRRIEASADVIDTKIELLEERVDLRDVTKKRRAIHRLVDTAGRAPDAVTRSLYLERIASALDVPREALEALGGPRERARGLASRGEPPAAKGPAVAPPGPRAPRGVVPPEIQDERYVLLHALHDPRWLDEARAAIEPLFFTVEAYGQLFERLLEDPPGGGDPMERIGRSEDTALPRVLAELEAWRGAQGFPLADEPFRDSLERLQLKAVERGVLPEFEPTGERLTDALRRRELERAIRRGRRGGAPPV